jgi:hypothetical protein
VKTTINIKIENIISAGRVINMDKLVNKDFYNIIKNKVFVKPREIIRYRRKVFYIYIYLLFVIFYITKSLCSPCFHDYLLDCSEFGNVVITLIYDNDCTILFNVMDFHFLPVERRIYTI